MVTDKGDDMRYEVILINGDLESAPIATAGSLTAAYILRDKLNAKLGRKHILNEYSFSFVVGDKTPALCDDR